MRSCGSTSPYLIMCKSVKLHHATYIAVQYLYFISVSICFDHEKCGAFYIHPDNGQCILLQYANPTYTFPDGTARLYLWEPY